MIIAKAIDNFNIILVLLSLKELEETRFLFESLGVPDDFFSKLIIDFCEFKLLLCDEVGAIGFWFAEFWFAL